MGKIAWLLFLREIILHRSRSVLPSSHSLLSPFFPLHLCPKQFNHVKEHPTMFHTGFSMAKQQCVAGVAHESIGVEIDHPGILPLEHRVLLLHETIIQI